MKARTLVVLCFAIAVLASQAFARGDGNSKTPSQKKQSCCVNGAKTQGAQTKADAQPAGQCDPASKECTMKSAGAMKDCPMMKSAAKSGCCAGKAKGSEAKNSLKKSKNLKTTTEAKGTQ